MRIVIHVDMDAFFAACEERYNPQFRGLPIVVGADPKQGSGRGVVSTANYPARKFGIHSAMPISQAWRLAEAARQKGEPETIFLRGNFELYSEVSKRIMAMLVREADAPPNFSEGKLRRAGFEQASIDEAYLDVSQLGSFEEAEDHARKLKAKILEAEWLTCSVGIGLNKLIAKIASDFRKPDGLTIVRSGEVESFLKPLSIRVIPGIGPKTEVELNRRGIRTVGDLQQIAAADLAKAFGKWGEDLFRKARGVDDSPVSNEWEPKSVGEQETFEQDTLQAAFILERARVLADAVFRRFRAEGFKSFRTAVVTVRFADFITLTRSHTAESPLSTLTDLNGEVLRILLPLLDKRGNPKQKKIRLIGVRVEKLLR